MLGNKLKNFRVNKKLSKAELSRMTGLSARTIEFLEKEKLKNPTLNTLRSLSNSLEIKIGDLIE